LVPAVAPQNNSQLHCAKASRYRRACGHVRTASIRPSAASLIGQPQPGSDRLDLLYQTTLVGRGCCQAPGHATRGVSMFAGAGEHRRLVVYRGTSGLGRRRRWLANELRWGLVPSTVCKPGAPRSRWQLQRGWRPPPARASASQNCRFASSVVPLPMAPAFPWMELVAAEGARRPSRLLLRRPPLAHLHPQSSRVSLSPSLRNLKNARCVSCIAPSAGRCISSP
jgi:hypothetical protein